MKDPLEMFRGAKPRKIVPPTPRQHKEADLHLSFCKWLKFQHPQIPFIRHEREKSRNGFVGGLFRLYNNLDGVPDFEMIWPCSFTAMGLYIEFKKPGESWTLKDGTIKREYLHQYLCHQKLWKAGRCAYFCNDIVEAIRLATRYIDGNPVERQVYGLPLDNPPATL